MIKLTITTSNGELLVNCKEYKIADGFLAISEPYDANHKGMYISLSNIKMIVVD